MPSVSTCRALAKVYDVTFEELWEAIEDNGSEDSQLQPGWFDVFVTLEQSATALRTWEPVLVPGLLQTEDYARAVVLADERLVERRLRRQHMVNRHDNPIGLVAVIDESVLHRPIGGTKVLVGQLRHLVDVSTRPNITLHVCPWQTKAPPFATTSVVMLSFDWGEDGLVYIQHRQSAAYLDQRPDIATYVDHYDELVEMSLSPDDSREFILRRIGDLER